MEDRKRILIVEGDDALRTMLFTILRHQPLDVDTASTYDDAMKHVASCDYAVILVDLTLPSTHGHSFVYDFRRERPTATTFLIGITDDNSDKLDAVSVNILLQKPFEITSLAEAIRECALVIPPSEDFEPPCPPPESAGVQPMDESGSFYTN